MYLRSDACHVVACSGMINNYMICPSSLMYHLSDVCHVIACNGMIYDMSVMIDVSSQ